MRLGDRLKQPGSEGAASPATETTPEVKRRDSFELKVKVHRILIERLDLSKLISVEREKLEGEFRQEVAKILQELRPGANGGEEGKIVDEILDEIFGLGPIEPLLNAPAVEEIMVNGAKQVYVARHGKIVLTDTIFKDNDHLLKIIERIVSRVGRRVDESSPMVDARLLDGSRVNAVIPPLALKGPSLTIRLFPKKRLEVEDLLSLRTLSEPMVELLKGCVNARLNLLVSGGTGSGKTTLLNVLSRFIPADERIVTIEDSAELQLQQEHVITLESRPPNVEGQGAVTTRDLVRNCLRMRPDRIVVGEVRGGGGGGGDPRHAPGHEHGPRRLHFDGPRQHAPGRPEPPRGHGRHGGPRRAP